eukprot:TRINITY_DN4913_c2_g1_i1.p1 TRINITY_DN4913_c2_g1~~TRINITY_DN4913_c2_g1_i1.p1  ORF type:complete len:930 (+),score=302.73 TRINITY_DN4913_c2_g1_i1:70-2790(+)
MAPMSLFAAVQRARAQPPRQKRVAGSPQEQPSGRAMMSKEERRTLAELWQSSVLGGGTDQGLPLMCADDVRSLLTACRIRPQGTDEDYAADVALIRAGAGSLSFETLVQIAEREKRRFMHGREVDTDAADAFAAVGGSQSGSTELSMVQAACQQFGIDVDLRLVGLAATPSKAADGSGPGVQYASFRELLRSESGSRPPLLVASGAGEGAKGMPVSDLLSRCESLGCPPDIAQEIAAEADVRGNGVIAARSIAALLQRKRRRLEDLRNARRQRKNDGGLTTQASLRVMPKRFGLLMRQIMEPPASPAAIASLAVSFERSPATVLLQLFAVSRQLRQLEPPVPRINPVSPAERAAKATAYPQGGSSHRRLAGILSRHSQSVKQGQRAMAGKRSRRAARKLWQGRLNQRRSLLLQLGLLPIALREIRVQERRREKAAQLDPLLLQSADTAASAVYQSTSAVSSPEFPRSGLSKGVFSGISRVRSEFSEPRTPPSTGGKFVHMWMPGQGISRVRRSILTPVAEVPADSEPEPPAEKRRPHTAGRQREDSGLHPARLPKGCVACCDFIESPRSKPPPVAMAHPVAKELRATHRRPNSARDARVRLGIERNDDMRLGGGNTVRRALACLPKYWMPTQNQLSLPLDDTIDVDGPDCDDPFAGRRAELRHDVAEVHRRHVSLLVTDTAAVQAAVKASAQRHRRPSRPASARGPSPAPGRLGTPEHDGRMPFVTPKDQEDERRWDDLKRRMVKYDEQGRARPLYDKRLHEHYFGIIPPPKHAAQAVLQGRQDDFHGLMEFVSRDGPVVSSRKANVRESDEEEQQQHEQGRAPQRRRSVTLTLSSQAPAARRRPTIGSSELESLNVVQLLRKAGIPLASPRPEEVEPERPDGAQVPTPPTAPAPRGVLRRPHTAH